ncbi:MAG TPA: SgcJ/EcaC family oxidoreductase [Candidatus Acidoferrales bacterium]|nr:SgcJ/EcaC family oxidoreductase [Candidatus Acidoferrales bacterium]
MSRNRALLAFASTLVACIAAACAQPQPAAPVAPPDTRETDAATIRAADADFAKFAAAKDLDKCMSYYADDAVAFAPGLPAMVGKDNIRKFIQGMIAAPNMQMTFTDQTVDVARSGDLAVDSGSFHATVTDKKGKATTSNGRFVLVWKKQADGSWRIAADTSANEK